MSRAAGEGARALSHRARCLAGAAVWLVAALVPALALAGADRLAPPVPASAPLVPDEVLADLPITRDVLRTPPAIRAREGDGPPHVAAAGDRHLFALRPVPPSAPGLEGPLRIEYTLDPRLTRLAFEVLERRKAGLATIVMLDAETGRVLAYAAGDPERFPPTRTYPAASLIKVVTAAAALHHDRPLAEAPCRFLGSPYYLSPKRVDPPRKGRLVSLEGALATSNNQCFAQLAVHALGTENMVDAIRRFGFLQEPAPAHAPGVIDPGSDRYGLGKLGCGLWGCWITPMHAARLAMTLANGRQVEPWWIRSVTDGLGRPLRLPPRRPPKQVLTPALADELREMMVETTVSGTARRGFQRKGTPRLGPVRVSGKTGSLSGKNPDGLYGWFAGVAPADDPRLAIAVVTVRARGRGVHAAKLAGELLEKVFCEGSACDPLALEQSMEPWGGTARTRPAGPAHGG